MRSKRKKAIILDLAGVVLLTVKGTFNSLLAERLGVEEEDIARVMNDAVNDRWDLGEICDDEFYEHLLNEVDQPPEKKTVLEKFVIDDFYIDQGLLAVIHKLHKYYKTALLTNFPAHLHEFMKRKWITGDAFDHVIASCDVKLLKPDPRMYQTALNILGCSTEEALFIDDREVNIRAAESMGIKSILYQNRQQAIDTLYALLEASQKA